MRQTQGFVRRATLSLTFVAIGLLGCAGCAEDPVVELPICSKIRGDLDDAKIALQSANYDTALALLQIKVEDESQHSALNTCKQFSDLNSRNAHLVSETQFLLFMARSIGWMDTLVKQTVPIVTLIFENVGGFAPGTTFTPQQAFEALAGQGLIEGTLESMLLRFRNEVLAPNQEALTEIAKDKGFSIKMTPLIVELAGIKIVDVGGEYDLGEIYMMRAINNFLLGTVDGIIAIELNIDVLGLATGDGDLISYVPKKLEELDLVAEDEKMGETIRLVMNILAVVMHNSSPTLFTVDDVQSLKNGASETGAAFGDFLKAIEHMREDVKRDKDQTDDVFGYSRDGDNNETITVHFKPLIEVGIVNISELQDLEIVIPEGFLDSVVRIEEAFLGQGAGTIGWASDIVPIIALGVVTILKSGAFNGLIEAILSQADMPQATVDSILELLHSEFLDPTLIGGFLTELVPDVFRLNIKKYVYETPEPVGLRAWIPLWTTPVSEPGTYYSGDVSTTITIFDAWPQVNFVYEYECAEKDGTPVDPFVDGSFLCKQVVDEEHFTSDAWAAQFTRQSFLDVHGDGTRVPHICEEQVVGEAVDGTCTHADGITEDYGLRADGPASPLPYFLVTSPSAGGLFELNFNDEQNKVKPMGDYYVTEWQPANAYSFNAFVALIASQVTGFLGSD